MKTRAERLARTAARAGVAALQARDILQNQTSWDVYQLRAYFDELVRTVETLAHLISDLASELEPISASRSRWINGLTIVETHGNHPEGALDIVDEGDHVRIRVREPSGNASFSATDSDLQAIVAKLAELINRRH